MRPFKFFPCIAVVFAALALAPSAVFADSASHTYLLVAEEANIVETLVRRRVGSVLAARAEST